MNHLTRYALIFAIIMVQAFALFAILVNYQQHTEQVLREHAFEVLGNMLDNVRDNTKRYLSPAEKVAQLTRSLIMDGVLDPYDDAALEQYFLSQLKILPNITNIYLGREDGSFILVAQLENESADYRTKIIKSQASREAMSIERNRYFEETQRWTNVQNTYDPRERVWYPLARNTTLPVWSNPYIFFGLQQSGITTSIEAVDSKKQVVGVIGVDIKLEGLSHFIKKIPISTNGKVVIYTDEGMIVASQSLSEEKLQDAHLPRISESAPFYIQRMLQSIPFSVDSSQREYYIFPATAEKQRRHYGLQQPFLIDDYSTDFWHIAAEAPVDDFVGSIRYNYRRGLRNAVIIGVFAMLGTLLLALNINRPLANLYQRATIDRLTKIINRDEFMRRAENIRQKMVREGSSAVIAILDLDGFKPVNDIYGHAVGDEVLHIFAQRLKHTLPQGGIVGRLGGDEFVLVLRKVSARNAIASLERIRHLVTKDVVISSAGHHSIGATIGVSELFHRRSIAESLNIADSALLKGKRTRKNRSYFASSLDDDYHIVRFLRDKDKAHDTPNEQ